MCATVSGRYTLDPFLKYVVFGFAPFATMVTIQYHRKILYKRLLHSRFLWMGLFLDFTNLSAENILSWSWLRANLRYSFLMFYISQSSQKWLLFSTGVEPVV